MIDNLTEREKKILSSMIFSEHQNGVCIVPPCLLDEAKKIVDKLYNNDKCLVFSTEIVIKCDI